MLFEVVLDHAMTGITSTPCSRAQTHIAKRLQVELHNGLDKLQLGHLKAPTDKRTVRATVGGVTGLIAAIIHLQTTMLKDESSFLDDNEIQSQYLILS